MSVIKLLTWNIHKGFSGGGRYTLPSMKRALSTLDLDLIFLQEVQGEHRRKEKRIKNWQLCGQSEFLAESYLSHHVYGENRRHTHGHHGNAILSRFPILSSRVYEVSASRFEARGLLHSQLLLSGSETPIEVICIHFGLLRRWRRKQLNLLESYVKEGISPDAPLIVAGDFNEWSAELGEILKTTLGVSEAVPSGRRRGSFPASIPVIQLDRVFFRGFQQVSAKRLSGRPWRALADHLPLYVELSSE